MICIRIITTKSTHRQTEKDPLPITGSCRFNKYDWKNGEFYADKYTLLSLTDANARTAAMEKLYLSD